MSGFKNFAIAGAGLTGRFIVHQFLKEKAAGNVNEVVVLTREVRFAAVLVASYITAISPSMTGIKDDHRRRCQGHPSRLYQQRISQERSHRHRCRHLHHWNHGFWRTGGNRRSCEGSRRQVVRPI